MNRSKALAAAWRPIVIILCVCVAPLAFGQGPPNQAQTKPTRSGTRGVIRPQDLVVLPRTSTVPPLFGKNRVEVARVLEPLHLQPKFLGLEDGIALAQDPAAGTKVPYGSGVAVTLGRMPQLVLNGPAAPAYAGSALTFSVAFVPPLPAGPKAIYHFTWGDGSPVESTGKAVIAHRFADAGARVVSVIWTLDDRVKIGSARVVVDILPSPTPTPPSSDVPLLFGMNHVQVARVLESLHLRPAFSGIKNGIAVDQKPPAGTKVPYGSGVAVTLGLMPQLVLNGPAAPAYAGSELTFSVAFVPPLPAGPKAIYHFTWGDGSPIESTRKAVITHRFADAGARVVSVIWTLDDRVKIGSAIVAVDVLPLPPPTPSSDTAETATVSDTSTATTQTATASDTSTTTATATRVDTATTSSTTETGSATSDATPPTPTGTTPTVITQTTETGGSIPKPGPFSNLLLWIGAAAVVLLLVVTFLLARVLRALNRRPSEAQVQAKSPVAFKGGMRSVEYEIEHPELVRRMPAVGLRGGIRGEGDGDV